ncbi:MULTISPECIES: patatin-like phospholipase family protein [Cobetia]|uniref:patatin-like phospholipase family protein n=1 Tax=Cobetia TaxID=204286 RepID=UPI00178D02AD|nr:MULTISPECIES: patatin-like phospholipase family protein [Cobetia]MBE2169527.1 patatin-like phospholipase family protein [Cobetia sp. 2AS1]MBS4153669.1 patatin-like phospholipase family protein [Cobetia sp. MC34]MCK8069132.1 patatin-like phospholipase family protein [Cobetia sp. 1CM21F]MDH2294479.1 patatin-like phospholipase family protein [Cobetia sp. 1AS1]MDH2422848.1 patatin-like phospholipase family protein [Cobetia litoralis]
MRDTSCDFCADALNILVLQGGGALGAYQIGIFEALAEAGIQPDWVVGTSVGAINGALIAGNPEGERLKALESFWYGIAQPAASMGPAFHPWERSVARTSAMLWGIPGFFRPRPLWTVPIWQSFFGEPPSLYDTEPLGDTLNRLVDFERLDARHPENVRLSVGAVNIGSGALRYFDSSHEALDHRHILASGALPPAFPPVWVDGEAYWDGGLYSNTPVSWVLSERPHGETVVNCYVIDLWSADGKVPETLQEAQLREKDIQYSSRAGEHLNLLEENQALRMGIENLADHLPEELRQSPKIQRILAMTQQPSINVVRLLASARPGETSLKDIDFSRATIDSRRDSGYQDMQEVLSRCSQFAPLPEDIGVIVRNFTRNAEGELVSLSTPEASSSDDDEASITAEDLPSQATGS